ncbi:MAG TPA: aminotransferase class V-fold PLP-dependent enzyme [Candidatus Eisenbacteria bacterium]|nr:aminotransferase class V-fold PLP-dependent enzyme [Candidatus Eisenbacteria bacterium]
MLPLGREALPHWPLDPGITYLNHGTVGVTPLRVLAAEQAIRADIERRPAQFLLRELSAVAVGVPREKPPRMREAAARVAAFLGAREPDLVFVDNATTGVNAVLRSFDLKPGDEIVVTDLSYGGVARSAKYAAERAGGTVKTVETPAPSAGGGAIADAIVDAIGPRTRIAIVDHVASESSLILPLQEIAARARAKGALVLGDGAHALGMLPVDIPSLGVDWYTGNLHKWAWSPRSAGILWADPKRHAGLHPTVISWGLGDGIAAEFDWVGTRNPAAYLAAPAGIDLLHEWGLDRVRAHNHALAWDAAVTLPRRWGTETPVPESMVGSMVTLPLPHGLGDREDDAARLRDSLLFEDRIEVQIHAFRGRLWTRISTQVYNDGNDLERLGAAVAARV